MVAQGAADAAEPAPSTSPRRRRLLLAAALAVALVAAVGIVLARRGPGPVEVVEEFFAAIRARDVERALSYVGRRGSGVPYGEAAAFLHPDAIADGWWLREVRAGGTNLAGDLRMRVSIEDERGHAEGFIEVSDSGGEWKLVSPFVTVGFGPNPFSYLQVNDRVLTDQQRSDPQLIDRRPVHYQLLPGRYRFFGELAGSATEPGPAQLLLPTPAPRLGTEDAVPVTVPPLRFPEPTQAAAQRRLNELLDDCTTFAVREPPGCPFAAASSLEYDGGWVDSFHDISWRVVRYPEVRLIDPGGAERGPGLLVEVADPGVIRFAATGLDERGALVEVDVDCEITGEYLRATLGPDGTPEVAVVGLIETGFSAVFEHPPGNTCEGGDA
ncbi:MAG TPA: hypothetical protein VIL37_08495 [Natronosporangium sp.]